MTPVMTFAPLHKQVTDMAKDAELDRLKVAQDRAFQRKQDAYQAQQKAWDRRSSARDALNSAYETKQRAYAEQDRTWQDYQNVRSSNGPRIDSLNAQQEQAYESMRRSYDAASSAYDRRDGASASSYAAEGRRYKEEAQHHVAERRRLVEEIRSARANHEASKPAFQRAKDDFSAAKRIFDSAKAEHERAQIEFKRAKVEFDSCVKAFKARLEKVKAEGQKRRNDKKDIATKAGVPYRYRDNVWVSTDSNGNTNIYFGGVGKPNGPGHGHYVMDRSGKVTYKRDPYDPHGAQNFTDQDGNRGATLYDRRARSGKEPKGAEGIFARRDGGREHVTQYYDDKYRLSSDIVDNANVKRHWTNQNFKKKHPDRHTPPKDDTK